MKLFAKLIIGLLIAFDIVLFLWILLHGHTIPVLHPEGLIALKERNLIFILITVGLSIIVPVVILTFLIAWKYREGNTNAQYTPEVVHKKKSEIILWCIPIVIVLFLAILNWKSTHELDPYKPIASGIKPVIIQVVATRWKWIFIYPEQNIATVNFMQFPVHTPITIELTGDNAPMNSFWIPSLSGQMYAMTGMETQLHILADTPGNFAGSAAEISGQGFAGMKFIAHASSLADFNDWVQSVRKSSKPLDSEAYKKLIQPSENVPVTFYAPVEGNLYNTVIMRYMAPTKTIQNMNGMKE